MTYQTDSRIIKVTMNIVKLSTAPKGQRVHFHSLTNENPEIMLELQKYGMLFGDSFEVEGHLGEYVLLVHEKFQLVAISNQFAQLMNVEF